MGQYDPNAEERLDQLVRSNPHYPREAYEFISEALAYTGQALGVSGHLTGQQLCEGARRMALERFGYLARTVLASWNVHRTDDFGQLVYNMIEADLLRKAETDSIDDFRDVYDFHEALDESFRIELETKS